MKLTRWQRFKHWLGFCDWGELQDDYSEWVKAGRDGDIAYWKTCRICARMYVIQTRY